jgi:hypothetical protein
MQGSVPPIQARLPASRLTTFAHGASSMAPSRPPFRPWRKTLTWHDKASIGTRMHMCAWGNAVKARALRAWRAKEAAGWMDGWAVGVQDGDSKTTLTFS